MTLANQITLLRVLLIPPFCILILLYSESREWLRHAALGVYIFVAASDFLDGYIARNYNQKSRLGTRLDPLADKLIINLGFVFLAANDAFSPGLPLWFPVFILARDIGIVMGAYGIKMYAGRVRVEPQFVGKLTTVFQLSTMIGVLLGVSFVPWLIVLTVTASLASGLGYIQMGYRQLATKASG